MKGKKTVWTPEMVSKLKNEFPTRISVDIAQEMNLSLRTIIRKARELGLVKVDGFLDIMRPEITKRAKSKLPPNPHKGDKSFRIPNGEKYQFRKGHIPRSKWDEELVQRIHQTRNQTIKREKIRLRYGMKPLTKLKINPW